MKKINASHYEGETTEVICSTKVLALRYTTKPYGSQKVEGLRVLRILG